MIYWLLVSSARRLETSVRSNEPLAAWRLHSRCALGGVRVGWAGSFIHTRVGGHLGGRWALRLRVDNISDFFWLPASRRWLMLANIISGLSSPLDECGHRSPWQRLYEVVEELQWPHLFLLLYAKDKSYILHRERLIQRLYRVNGHTILRCSLFIQEVESEMENQHV